MVETFVVLGNVFAFFPEFIILSVTVVHVGHEQRHDVGEFRNNLREVSPVAFAICLDGDIAIAVIQVKLTEDFVSYVIIEEYCDDVYSVLLFTAFSDAGPNFGQWVKFGCARETYACYNEFTIRIVLMYFVFYLNHPISFKIRGFKNNPFAYYSTQWQKCQGKLVILVVQVVIV